MRQVQLAPQAHVNLPAGPGTFDLDERWLAATAGNGLFVFDVSLPGMPRLVFQLSLDGARGALLDASGVLAWGAGGLQRLEYEGWRPSRLAAEPVAAALRLGDRLLLANASGLYWFLPATGAIQPVMNVPGIESLAYSAGTLAWTAGGQAFAARLADMARLPLAGQPANAAQPLHLPNRAASVEAPVFCGGPLDFLVNFIGGSSAVFDLSDLNAPAQLEQFAGKAWFAGARASDSLLALPELGGLSLYTAGRVADA